MSLRRAASVVSFACLLLSATAAHAQITWRLPNEDAARRAFEEGSALEKKQDFAAALEKFVESERIKPTLGNRYHKAYCLEMTGKLAAALSEYEAVEKSAREVSKNDLSSAALARIDPLRARVPTLVLVVPASALPAETMLDGVVQPPARLDGQPFRIDPGEHEVISQSPNREPFSRKFTAAEGTSSSVEIVFGPPPSAPIPSVQPAKPARSRALPIATTAGAIGLAGVGVGAFIIAGQKQDDLRKQCLASRTCEDAKGPTRTLDWVALGSWVGAAGLAAVSYVLWTSTPSPATQARLTLRSTSVGVEGEF